MTDPERPFRSLARPAGPVDPDPLFAARLRERLERALLQKPPVPTEPRSSAVSALIPYLVVRDARAAITCWLLDTSGL